MTNAQWEAAHKKVEQIMNISKDKNSFDWIMLVHKYYMEELPKEVKMK